MGWFGKIVGGGVGALIGGPAGAAIGFGLGTLYDKAASPGFEEGLLAGAEASTFADETGTQIVIKTGTAIPDSILCAITFFSENEQPLTPSSRTGDRFRSSSGQLLIPGAIRDDVIFAYLPGGALPRRVSQKIFAVVTLVGRESDGTLIALGQTPFLMEAPGRKPWCRVEIVEPLVLLAMRVARSDGELHRAEIRQVRDRMERMFELEPRDQDALRAIMKSTKPWLANHDLLDAAHRRLPLIDMEDVLALLAEVAQADGVVSPAEVDIIRELAIGYYGASPNEWGSVERVLGLEVIEQIAKIDYWVVLGLSEGATRAQIKKAYHAKMLDYHPDKVANLAAEFQELAHQKTIEIRAAYEGLLRIVD